MAHRFSSALALLVAWLLLGCSNPCVQLAERICGCELSASQRRTCRDRRITNRSDQLQPTPEEQEVCAQALETCTCDALDENRADLCALTREDLKASQDSNEDAGVLGGVF